MQITDGAMDCLWIFERFLCYTLAVKKEKRRKIIIYVDVLGNFVAKTSLLKYHQGKYIGFYHVK